MPLHYPPVKTHTTPGADSKSKQAEPKAEGLVSDEERERRRQMDEEMEAMFEPIADGEEEEGGGDDAGAEERDIADEVRERTPG